MKALLRLSAAAFSSIRKLSQKKYRLESGRFILEGVHLVREALDAGASLEMVLVTAAGSEKKEIMPLLARAGSTGVPVYAVPEEDLDRLGDAVTSQGILAVATSSSASLGDFWTVPRRDSVIVALEHVSDPGNVGTMLRTCDWFGADAVLLGRGCVELRNPKVLRATMGALFHLPVFEDLILLEVLGEAKSRGYEIAATALDGGEPFSPGSFGERTIVVFGSEADGLSPEVLQCADRIVTIPRFGRGESLNVASACAVILGGMRIR